jgi:hypothetical protein
MSSGKIIKISANLQMRQMHLPVESWAFFTIYKEMVSAASDERQAVFLGLPS